MLGIARTAEKGLIAAAAITAAIAFLGVMSFDMNMFLGLLALPVASMVSSAVLAFVVLRHGEKAGLTSAALAGFVMLVASLALRQNAIQVLVFPYLCWAAAMLVASVLRGTISLKAAVQITVPAAVIIGAVANWFKAEFLHFWQYQLSQMLSAIPPQELEKLGTDKLSVLDTDLPTALVVSAGSWAFFVVLCGVLLARFWQAQLFNVGGFQKEFHSLRVGREFVFAFVALFALAHLFSGSILISSAVSVMILVFFIQGLSVVHCLVKQRGMSKNWLVGIYVLLIVPPTMLVLSVLGIADNIFRLRKI